jgi:hypothetical protein
MSSYAGKVLAGELTTLRMTAQNGTDLFDGGKLNIQYDNNGQTALVVPPGTVVQVQNFQSGTPAGGSVLIPFDNTIPQITEGWEWDTLSFTPKFASSKLRIQTTLYCTGDAPSGNVLMAPIFRDGAADAIQTSMKHMQLNSFEILSSDFIVDALTTNSQDFMVRVGQNLAGSSYVNAISGAEQMGGTAISSITITEIQPNAVAPGPVETDMLNVIPEARKEAILKAVHTGRFARPSEVAKTIVWLATECPEYINGTCLDINNGAFPR